MTTGTAASDPDVRLRSLPGRTVTLEPGWNAVGFEAEQVTSVTQAGQVAGVASWNGTSYDVANLAAPLNGRRGYWVYANSATSFTWSGQDDGQGAFVDLPVNGYNLVSLASDAEVMGTALTASQNGRPVPLSSVVLTRFYEIGTDRQYTAVEVAAGGVLKPGKAYWVFANTSAGPVRLNLPSGPAPSPGASPSSSPLSSPGASPSPGSSPQASPSGLSFAQPPPSSFSADTAFTVKVESTTPVTLSLGGAPSGGQLNGPVLTAAPVNGVVTFTGLSVNRVGAYTLRAQAGSLSVDSLPFKVSAGVAAAVRITQQPVAATLGVNILPYVGAEITDAQGNRVPGATHLVRLSVAQSGASLQGTVGRNAVDGRVAFTDSLQMDGMPGTYTLRAESDGLSTGVTDPFPAVPASAGGETLQFNPAPPSSTTVGQPITVRVQVTGATGNVITLAGVGMPTLTATATGGVASFVVAPTQVGTFTLSAYTPGLATASPSFTLSVGAGPAAGVRFAQQPASVATGENFGSPVAVEVVDAGGNRVTGATGSVVLSLDLGQGSLVGAATQPLTQGLATFPGLQLSRLSRQTRLRAGWNGFSVNSEVFAVTPELISRASDTLPVALGARSTSRTFTSLRRALSAEGRYALFLSSSMPGGNGAEQVYRRDRLTGSTEVVTSHNGVLGSGNHDLLSPCLSPDGRYVTFTSVDDFGGAFTTRGLRQVFLRDMNGPTLRLVSATAPHGTVGGDSESYQAVVSENGAYVAYQSYASNLAGGVATPGQIYRYQASTGLNALVSTRDGTVVGATRQPTDITPDGDAILFLSGASSALLDLTSGTGVNQLYRKRMSTGTLELVSRRAGGGARDGANDASTDGHISADGTRVALTSTASDLTSPPTATGNVEQVFYRDLAANASVLVSRRAGGVPSQGTTGRTSSPAISADGRFVAFTAAAGDLLADVTAPNGVYRWQVDTTATVLASRSPGGAPMASSFFVSLTGDGQQLLFSAAALDAAIVTSP